MALEPGEEGKLEAFRGSGWTRQGCHDRAVAQPWACRAVVMRAQREEGCKESSHSGEQTQNQEQKVVRNREGKGLSVRPQTEMRRLLEPGEKAILAIKGQRTGLNCGVW